MVASAFLPVTIYKNRIHFLFGKEAHDDSAPGFSDFGGGVKPNEDIYYAGLREFAEETTGFLGDAKELEKMITKNGGCYSLVHGDYHIHIFRMDYDPMLVQYYNNSHRFIAKRVNAKILRKTMIFEKVEIEWMTANEMRQRRSEFRHFYREILDQILLEVPQIEKFIQSTKPRNVKSSVRKSRRKY